MKDAYREKVGQVRQIGRKDRTENKTRKKKEEGRIIKDGKTDMRKQGKKQMKKGGLKGEKKQQKGQKYVHDFKKR